MNQYKPDFYYKSIYDINYEKLRQKNIKVLLFDLDNTIVEAHHKVPSEKARKLLIRLKKEGFRIILFSNSPKKRLELFKKTLGVEYNSMSLKPLQYGFRKVFKKFHLTKKETAIIGDQLLTDIVGGNKFGITTILVTPITSLDFFLTKINRYRENKIIDYLEKKGLFKRGEYDA